MAPMPAGSALLLLLVLLGPLPASSQTHAAFLRKHMDYPKTDPNLTDRLYCNHMMQRRGMTTPICKEFNTFIHAPTNDVDAICTNRGTHSSGNLYNSSAYFNLTNCKVNGPQRPPCNYRGFTSYQRIQVACENSLPVHFQRRILVSG
ncbi:ribonuclease-like [Eublepharis macularius]|uniref:Ribonuclease-like n=1 Tax=Eublepharis macularius TaxID=481883 RepID=A0AA97K730_EUBMA|nr:ribonuclease-like [Eublepharis macularius]